MKRFFASDAESDMLIAEATKTFGLKIGDIIKRTSTTTVCRLSTNMWKTAATIITAMMSRFW